MLMHIDTMKPVSYTHLSRWEGLPIALLEAMYMEKPCVVSNVTGNCDVIKNKVNGYMCNTVDEFVNAIEACRNRCV